MPGCEERLNRAGQWRQELVKPSAAGAFMLLVNIHAHQHWGLCPALSSFKGRTRQSSQRGEGVGQAREAARPQSGHRGQGELVHRGAWFCSVSRAGPEASSSSSFSSDSCALVRGPRAGASREAARLTPLPTPLLPIPERLRWAGSPSPSEVEKPCGRAGACSALRRPRLSG